jgi:hypothetical protein
MKAIILYNGSLVPEYVHRMNYILNSKEDLHNSIAVPLLLLLFRHLLEEGEIGINTVKNGKILPKRRRM